MFKKVFNKIGNLLVNIGIGIFILICMILAILVVAFIAAKTLFIIAIFVGLIGLFSIGRLIYDWVDKN